MRLAMADQERLEVVKRHVAQQKRRGRRSAAARKGWRTRKAMQKAREAK